MWECKGGQSQTLPSDNHIGSWNPILLNESMGQNNGGKVSKHEYQKWDHIFHLKI
jgi:hypothetical protein